MKIQQLYLTNFRFLKINIERKIFKMSPINSLDNFKFTFFFDDSPLLAADSSAACSCAANSMSLKPFSEFTFLAGRARQCRK